MSENAKTYVFGNDGSNLLGALAPLMQQKGVDPAWFAMLNNNGWGGNNAFFLLLLVLLWGNNGWGGFGGNNGAVQALNGDAGRELLMNAINGNASSIDHLATVLNTDFGNVQSAINAIQLAVSSVGNTVGLSGQQVINAIQAGNASLGQQLCKCCCDNQLAIANQTSALQSGIFNAQTALQTGITDNKFANQMGQSAIQHSIDMMGASDNLAICQQTNTLQNNGVANTQRIVDAISGLQNNMTREFCEARERDMQIKIDTQSELITQLRGQLSNNQQTAQLYAMINPLQVQLTALANKMPNTVPVVFPDLSVVNNTPTVTPTAG